jgi:hypothetical protein
MKAAFVVALLLAAIATAQAQSRAPDVRALEDRYIADRDRAIARFTPEKVKRLGDDAAPEADAAFAALEQQMRAILGPIEIAGLPESKLNLGSLYTGDMGFGTLDGLLFHSADYKTAIVVTTRTLFLRWLRAHRSWHGDTLPREPARAFATETFYFQAIDSDAAILKFADVPLGGAAARPAPSSAPNPARVPPPNPAQDIATAMLAGRTQDQTPYAANEVFVAAIKGGRAFVGFARLEPAFQAAACRAAREEAEQKAKAANEAAYANGGVDEAAAKRATALEQKTEAEFRSCFARSAAKEAAFADVVKRAEALYGMMKER